MRILIVNSERGIAGGLTSAADLATGLTDAGHDTTVVCHPASELRRRLESHGVPVAAVAIRAELNAWRAVQIARVLRRISPDVVLADRRKDVKLAFAALQLRPGAALVHRHGAPSPLRNSPLYRAIWSRLDRMIVNSDAMRRTLTEATPWLASVPIDVIPNGKDIGYWRPRPDSRAAARAALRIDVDAFVIAYHGVLQRRKNVDRLLRASGLMSVPPHVLIIGDGPDAVPLSRLAESLKLKVTFTGRRDDLPQLLSAADVAVHLSRAEGFSNAVIEALACGVPVFASDAASHGEQVDDGSTGELVDSADPATIAVLLDGLAADPARRRAMSLAARAAAVERFSLDRMIGRYVDSLRLATNRP